MGVAPAASAALCGDKRLVRRHVRHQSARFVVKNERPLGHGDNQILARFSEAALRAARLSRRGGVFAFIAEIRQRVQPRVHLEHDVAAAPAVAAVGAARRDIFLAVKRHGAVAAVPRFHGDHCLVDKHTLHFLSF